jgi:hypothetical protein
MRLRSGQIDEVEPRKRLEDEKVFSQKPLSSFPGLPDFSWYMIPKPEKCTK